MMRLLAGIRLDFRLQWRYGFHYAALFSIFLWEIPIILLPDHLLPTTMPYLIFGDLALVGFFFIVGAVFFERGERTLFANLVTPMRFRDYLGAKLSTLTLLSLGLSLIIAVSGVGLDVSLVPLVSSVLLCSMLFLLAGFISAAPFQSVSDWFIPSTMVIAVLNIPLLDYSGLWQHPIMYIVPTHGSLMMMGAAFGQLDLSGWQWVYAIGYQLLWVVLLAGLAKRVFTRFIIQREGSA